MVIRIYKPATKNNHSIAPMMQIVQQSQRAQLKAHIPTRKANLLTTTCGVATSNTSTNTTKHTKVLHAQNNTAL